MMGMPRRFENKVILVTGAGSGIGRTASVLLAAEGAKVAVCDMDAKGGDETVQQFRPAGGEGRFFQADVSVSSQVEAMVRQVVEAFGGLHGAFNNAGIMGQLYSPTADCPESNWDRVLSTNLKGVWLCMKYEIPRMLESGGGAIVNNSSVAGLSGSFASAPYTASKHGVIGLTKIAAREWAAKGIRVNAVCPGYIETPMVLPMLAAAPRLKDRIVAKEPMGRLGTPEEVARAALWLLSDESSFVTGHAMAVDGGILSE